MGLKGISRLAIFIVIVTCSKNVFTNELNNDEINPVEVSEDKLAKQLFAVLDHYKQNDPVGLPAVEIPDPLPVPDIKQSMGMATLEMKNVKASGLSKFRIKHIKLDLKELKGNAGIQLDVMNVYGDYTLSSLFTKAQGPFKVTLKNVFVDGNATLGVNRIGKLETKDILMDITFSDMAMDFQNLGFLGSIFQGIINSAPNLIFDAIKPLMLKDVYEKMRLEIDTKLENALQGRRFPNSISPLDMAVAEFRKKIRSMGYDPFKVPDYNRTAGMFSAQMDNTWIMGASTIYRVGDIIANMINNTLIAKVQIGTQKITGTTQWSLTMGNGMISRAGLSQFTLDHIKVTVEVSQTLDTRKHPQINDLQIDLGNIQVRCDGAGTLDYVFEFLVNILPNLLRYQIMDAIENPLKLRIQEKLNQINVEQAIKANARSFGKLDLKL